MVYMFYRGGAGISKVVRPLHIKDDSCVCKEGGGAQSETTHRVASNLLGRA